MFFAHPRRYTVHGNKCPAGKRCEYSHKKNLFDANGKYVGKVKKTGVQNSAESGSAWDAPAGLTGAGAVVVVTSGLAKGSGAGGNTVGKQELVV